MLGFKAKQPSPRGKGNEYWDYTIEGKTLEGGQEASGSLNPFREMRHRVRYKSLGLDLR